MTDHLILQLLNENSCYFLKYNYNYNVYDE
jgi:hypothetical protein